MQKCSGLHTSAGAGAGAVGPPPPTSFPDDLDIHTIASELKKEGSDWVINVRSSEFQGVLGIV